MENNSYSKKVFISMIRSSIELLKKIGGDDLNDTKESENKVKIQSKSEIQEDFFMACAKGDLSKVVQKIQEGADINAPRAVHFFNTGLIYAAEGGHTEVINFLIDRGANIEQTNDDEETALHIAISRNKVDAAKVLISNNANLEAENIFQERPIHLSLARKQSDIVDLLINKGVNLECRDRYQNTPILIASKTDDYQNCLKLAQKGVNLNVKGNDGYSPAHLSSMFALEKNMVVLGFSGCDFNVPDDNGDLPGSLHNLVRKRPNPDKFVHHLNSDSYVIDNNFHMAAKLGIKEVCLGHLNAGRLPDELDQDGKTVLECAKENKQQDCVDLLSQYVQSFKVNTKNTANSVLEDIRKNSNFFSKEKTAKPQ
jgi:ankyrin repeat protein